MDDCLMEDVSMTSTAEENSRDDRVHTTLQPGWVDPPGPFDALHHHEGALLIVTCWDDQTSTPDRLQAFFTRWPPSRTPSLYCAWIAVDRGGQKPRSPNTEGLLASFQSLVSSENVTADEIDKIAITHGVLSGKWMIYTDTRRIDVLWGKVVRLLCLELKRGSVKVSPKQEGDSHVICVYVDDYSNMEEVNWLRAALRTAGVFWKIGFKPDAYTHLGIYAKNQWGIRPSRYYS
jgi:Domain of unknown function (DUF1917)